MGHLNAMSAVVTDIVTDLPSYSQIFTDVTAIS